MGRDGQWNVLVVDRRPFRCTFGDRKIIHPRCDFTGTQLASDDPTVHRRLPVGPRTCKIDDRTGEVNRVDVFVAIGVALGPGTSGASGAGEVDD